MDDGRTGYRVRGIEECADRVVELLADRRRARRLARADQAWVRDRYLLPRVLRDDLRLYAALLDPAAAQRETGRSVATD